EHPHPPPPRAPPGRRWPLELQVRSRHRRRRAGDGLRAAVGAGAGDPLPDAPRARRAERHPRARGGGALRARAAGQHGGGGTGRRPLGDGRQPERLHRRGAAVPRPPRALRPAAMKFDLLYELQAPKPHDERSEYRCYHEALAQIELADRLGYDTVWEVEHHFLTEFAHSSAPEVFLAAVAQRTRRIRLGHGVVVLPRKFNHPIPVAERVAALDLLSAGRVRACRAALAQARPVGKFVNDRVGAFTIVHVAETKEQAVANAGTEAAINYLLYALRVLGGFADPSGRGMRRDYAELEIKSTPYRDLIAKE